MSGFKRPALKAQPKETTLEQLAAIDEASEKKGFDVRSGAAAPATSIVKRGRPAKARTATEARPSFGLDPETHRLFKIWLLQNNISMQDYLEQHIKALVGSANS